MTHPERNANHSTFVIAWWAWTRLIAIVYFFAFASLGIQIAGLVGTDGILPAHEYMARASSVLAGVDRIRFLPTLAWIGSSNGFLRSLCAGGTVLSLLLAVGFVPALILPLLWVLYLSLVVIGRDFLAYQWDALLLEAGLLSALAAPLTLRHRLRDRLDPPLVGRILFLWLLVRLIVESGLVKLASGDPTWHDLTALTFHFWTQPIPTPVAYYANQLPLVLLKAATAATLAIELVAPVLVLAPPLPRTIGCGLLVGLQAVIALTGNYAFFNLLAAALCVWMLDDGMVLGAAPRRIRGALEAQLVRSDAPGIAGRARRALLIAFAVIVVPVSLYDAGARSTGLPLVAAVARAAAPFRSINAYGLFAVMTTSRPQIVVEGSDDGAEWKAYEFKYQPVDVRDRPPWVAPHQPRLDWQLWFAALSRYDDEPWFQAFLVELLRASPDVLVLVGHDPFTGRPPKYVRALLYQYRFSSSDERRRSGAWWTRELVGPYSPVLTAAARPRLSNGVRSAVVPARERSLSSFDDSLNTVEETPGPDKVAGKNGQTGRDREPARAGQRQHRDSEDQQQKPGNDSRDAQHDSGNQKGLRVNRGGTNSRNTSTAIFERIPEVACAAPSRTPRGAGYHVAAGMTF